MPDPDPYSRSGGGLMGFFRMFRSGATGAAEPLEAPTEATGALVSQAHAFQTLRVDDVMKPRADIVAIAQTSTFTEVVARFVEAEHSRMPVFKETLDEPVGVVHVKDVFKLLARKTRRPKPDDMILAGGRHLIRQVLYVPPSMRAAALLALMRSKRTHMALVIDEFGGTDGLVTLEDLLETLVGDIDDEHDEAENGGDTAIVEDAEGWVVEGRTPIADLEEVMGAGVDLAPPDLDEEIDTVGGLVGALAGRVPKRREILEHPGGYRIEVLSADPRRVKRVRVRRAQALLPPPDA